jgi:hypothetical protein
MQRISFKKRTMTLPKSFEPFLDKGNEFLVFQSDDELLLKQVRRPELKLRALMPSKEPPMSLEEIDKIVHEVRRETAKKR